MNVQATPRPMAPKQFIGENLNLLLPAGTKDRIDAVLLPGEKRLVFIRTLIDREIKRREKAKG
jgi:hypothetical protein